MIVEAKLQALGLRLPNLEEQYRANLSGARFLSHYAVQNLLYLSGTTPMKDGKPFNPGVVGQDLTLEQGYEAARYAVLASLAVKYALRISTASSRSSSSSALSTLRQGLRPTPRHQRRH
jgi:hypothetical protein